MTKKNSKTLGSLATATVIAGALSLSACSAPTLPNLSQTLSQLGNGQNVAISQVVQQGDEDNGVLLTRVDRASPAYAAGLRRGDIIVAVNGAPVNTAQELRDALGALKPATKANITISRGTAEFTYAVTLGDRDGNAYLGVTPFVEAAQAAPAPSAPSQSAPPQGNNQTAPRAMPRTAPTPAPQAPNAAPNPRQMPDFGQMMGAGKTTIAEVSADSPAEKAGLKAGDVVVAVNGKKVDAQNSLADLIGALKPGSKATLSIERDGKAQDLAVELGANPDNKDKALLGVRYSVASEMMRQPEPQNNMPGDEEGQGFDGFDLNQLPPELREQLEKLLPFLNQLPGRNQQPAQPGQPAQPSQPNQRTPRGQGQRPLATQGVVIREVSAGSPAEKAGLKVGDIIVEANGQKITNPQDMVSLVGGSKVGDSVKLMVKRDGEQNPVSISVTLAANPSAEGKAFMGISMASVMQQRFNFPNPSNPQGDDEGDGEEGGFEFAPGFSLPFDFGDLFKNLPSPQRDPNRKPNSTM